MSLRLGVATATAFDVNLPRFNKKPYRKLFQKLLSENQNINNKNIFFPTPNKLIAPVYGFQSLSDHLQRKEEMLKNSNYYLFNANYPLLVM